jgi:hypothetical protein
VGGEDEGDHVAEPGTGAKRDAGEEAYRAGEQCAALHREVGIEVKAGGQPARESARQPGGDAGDAAKREPEDQVIGEGLLGGNRMARAIAKASQYAGRQRGGECLCDAYPDTAIEAPRDCGSFLIITVLTGMAEESRVQPVSGTGRPLPWQRSGRRPSALRWRM